jgi:hypothetical protein
MVVRIRISTSLPRIHNGVTGNRSVTGNGVAAELASGLAGLLTLVSVACFTMSVWKLLSEMGWVGKFFIAEGVFSHWQVWIAGAVAAQLVSFRLSRPRPLIS